MLTNEVGFHEPLVASSTATAPLLPWLLAQPDNKKRVYLAIALSGLAVLVMGGIVPGLNSIYGVLHVEKVFRSQCTQAQQDKCANIPAGPNMQPCCQEQDYALTVFSTAALFSSDGVMLLYGELLDRKGPRWCLGVGVAMSWLGFALLSLNDASFGFHSDALWCVAFILVGAAGPGVFMGCLTFGECFPLYQPIFTAVCASMWDTSSCIFLLFSSLYFDAHLPFSVIALVWLVIVTIVGGSVWTQLPTQSQLDGLRGHASVRASVRLSSNGLADFVGEHVPPAGSAPSSLRSSTRSLAAPPSGANEEAMAPRVVQAPRVLPDPLYNSMSSTNGGHTLRHLFVRGDTILLLLFMSMYNLVSSFYIVTIKEQLATFLSSGEADAISLTFNIALPVGGALSSVGTVVLLKRLHHDEHLYMTLVVLLACAFSLANLAPFASIQYFAAVCFGPTRTLQWAAYFLFLEQPHRYPPAMVGRVIGYANLIIALVGDGAPSLLSFYVLHAAWPSSKYARFEFVKSILAAAICSCIAFPIYLVGERRRRAKKAMSRQLDPGMCVDPIRCVDDAPIEVHQTVDTRASR